MKNQDITVYRDVPAIYQDRYGNKFYGDVPIWTFNSITRKFMIVENRRGNAYACRNRIRYRKNKYMDQ